jgi:iron-sulfur cluster assembly accessory protein
MEENAQKTDRIFEFDGVKIACDFQSISYLSGIVIDYSNGLVGAGFTFHNPNAKGSCGCGSSFSV